MYKDIAEVDSDLLRRMAAAIENEVDGGDRALWDDTAIPLSHVEQTTVEFLTGARVKFYDRVHGRFHADRPAGVW